MYAFETKGGDRLALRPEGTASVLRAALEANLHKAGNLPGQALVLGLVLPLRAPAEGPLPPLLAGRRRGDRRGGPGARRRADHPGRPGVPLAGAAQLPHPAELPGRQGVPPGLPGRAAGLPARPGPRRGHAAPRRDQPAAGARRQARRRSRSSWRTPRCCATTCATRCKAYHEEVRELLTGRGRRLRGRPEAGARPGLLHAARPSSSSTTVWARSPRWAAAAATTACPR